MYDEEDSTEDYETLVRQEIADATLFRKRFAYCCIILSMVSVVYFLVIIILLIIAHDILDGSQ